MASQKQLLLVAQAALDKLDQARRILEDDNVDLSKWTFLDTTKLRKTLEDIQFQNIHVEVVHSVNNIEYTSPKEPPHE